MIFLMAYFIFGKINLFTFFLQIIKNCKQENCWIIKTIAKFIAIFNLIFAPKNRENFYESDGIKNSLFIKMQIMRFFICTAVKRAQKIPQFNEYLDDPLIANQFIAPSLLQTREYCQAANFFNFFNACPFRFSTRRIYYFI